MKNYYSILGVREDADRHEIKQAYRNLMRKWHPDVNRSVDATRRSEEVNLAYTVLSCPESRWDHDIELKEAGLSSKLLYSRDKSPCLVCGCKGYKKVYSPDFQHKIRKWLGLETPYKKELCVDCCGTGWEYRLKEF